MIPPEALILAIPAALVIWAAYDQYRYVERVALERGERIKELEDMLAAITEDRK